MGGAVGAIAGVVGGALVGGGTVAGLSGVGLGVGISVAGALLSQQQAGKQSQALADQQRNAAIQSATLLAETGQLAQQDILAGGQLAAPLIGLGAEEALARISPEVAPGLEAFQRAKALTLSGADVGGPFADAIRQATLQATQGPLFNRTGPVGAELTRQAGLNVSALTPAFRQQLAGQGDIGLGAAGQVSGIRQAGQESLADLASKIAAGRASATVGALPKFGQLAQQAGLAQTLANVGGGVATANLGEALARIGGQVINR